MKILAPASTHMLLLGTLWLVVLPTSALHGAVLQDAAGHELGDALFKPPD